MNSNGASTEEFISWLPAENETLLPIRSRGERPVTPMYAAVVIGGLAVAGFVGGVGLAALVTSHLAHKVKRACFGG